MNVTTCQFLCILGAELNSLMRFDAKFSSGRGRGRSLLRQRTASTSDGSDLQNGSRLQAATTMQSIPGISAAQGSRAAVSILTYYRHGYKMKAKQLYFRGQSLHGNFERRAAAAACRNVGGAQFGWSSEHCFDSK